jgi:type II secretory pathway pseudopilin PulG
MVVLTIIGILLYLSVPSFERGVEQARADLAAANLRALWSAQRLYWLENHTYTTSFSDLETLLDPAILSAGTFYVYQIQSADGTTFSATATRTGNTKWSGQFTIDQTGVVSGAVVATGEYDIVPGFQ